MTSCSLSRPAQGSQRRALALEDAAQRVGAPDEDLEGRQVSGHGVGEGGATAGDGPPYGLGGVADVAAADLRGARGGKGWRPGLVVDVHRASRN